MDSLMRFDLHRQADWAEFERQEAIDTKNAALEKVAESERSAAATPERDVDSEADSAYVGMHSYSDSNGE